MYAYGQLKGHFFSYAHSDLFAFIGPYPVTFGKDVGDFCLYLYVFVYRQYRQVQTADSLYHTRDGRETQNSSCWHYTSPGKSEPSFFS